MHGRAPRPWVSGLSTLLLLLACSAGHALAWRELQQIGQAQACAWPCVSCDAATGTCTDCVGDVDCIGACRGALSEDPGGRRLWPPCERCGYALVDGTCVACPDLCVACGSPDRCDQCFDSIMVAYMKGPGNVEEYGIVQNSLSGLCQMCRQGDCFPAKPVNADLFCKPGFLFEGGGCTSCEAAADGCARCARDDSALVTTLRCTSCGHPGWPVGKGLDAASGSCQPCADPLCLACGPDHQACVVCRATTAGLADWPGIEQLVYKAADGTCRACNASAGCTRCGPDGACAVCDDGFFLAEGGCLPCSDVDEHCATCHDGAGDFCITCTDGFGQDPASGACVPCPAHCTSCYSDPALAPSLICAIDGCEEGYVLLNVGSGRCERCADAGCRWCEFDVSGTQTCIECYDSFATVYDDVSGLTSCARCTAPDQACI